MKCPYCGIDMEIGVIQSPNEIAWLKGLNRPALGRASFHEGSVVLSKRSFIKGSAVMAYLCRGCQKIIIDCKDRYTDLNCT
jgi:hypothetical protein